METMTASEIRLFLSQTRLGHLGLTRERRAYVVPVFFGYGGGAIYFHSHPGLKQAYIAATDEACLAVTRAATEDRWESVLVFGTLAPVQLADDRLAAMDALMGVPLPPELGSSDLGEPKRSDRQLRLWKLTPTRLTGRKSVPPRREAAREIA